jgi:hypothetical protein
VASVPRVDEARLVARYRQVGKVAQCAREFGIGRNRAAAILARHGVPGRTARTVDEQAVLRAYARTRSVNDVSRLQVVAEGRVREILDRYGVSREPHGPRPDLGRETPPWPGPAE